MAAQLELVREELRLRLEIARHELACLAEDDAAADVLDAKIEECHLLMARQEALERHLRKLGVT
jgi:hypothetical protein